METPITIEKVNVLGMPLVRWAYESCRAEIGEGDDRATVYLIQSREKGKGHATYLLQAMKKFYEKQGKKFGGSVALNDNMARLYKKLGIPEYIDAE